MPYQIISFPKSGSTVRAEPPINTAAVDTFSSFEDDNSALRDLKMVVTEFLKEISAYQSELNNVEKAGVGGGRLNIPVEDIMGTPVEAHETSVNGGVRSVTGGISNISMPRDDVTVVMFYGKEGLEKEPLKTLVIYQGENEADGANQIKLGLHGPRLDAFIKDLLARAKQSVKDLESNPSVATDEAKSDGSSEGKTGYIVRFSVPVPGAERHDALPGTTPLPEDIRPAENPFPDGPFSKSAPLELTYGPMEASHSRTQPYDIPADTGTLQTDSAADGAVLVSTRIMNNSLVRSLSGGEEVDSLFLQDLYRFLSNGRGASEDSGDEMSYLPQGEVTRDGTGTNHAEPETIAVSLLPGQVSGKSLGDVNAVPGYLGQHPSKTRNLDVKSLEEAAAIEEGTESLTKKPDEVPGNLNTTVATSPGKLFVNEEGTLPGSTGSVLPDSLGHGERPDKSLSPGIPAGETFGRGDFGSFQKDVTNSSTGLNPGAKTALGAQDESRTGQVVYEPAPFPVTKNDLIINRIVRFVDDLNGLLNSIASDAERSESDLPEDRVIVGGHLLQIKSGAADVHTALQNVARKIIGPSQGEEMGAAELIGLLQVKGGLLRVDTSLLGSQLSSKKEETLGSVKEFANGLSDRINYFANPYAGLYMDDKNILHLRATRKDEGAFLLKDEIGKEKNAIEKRLKELQLLIERSSSLTEWFAEKGGPSPDPLEAPTLEITFQEMPVNT